MKRRYRAQLLTILLFPAAAMASGPYVGAAAGYSSADIHPFAVTYRGSEIALSASASGAAGRLFVGYSFNRYIALEAGWLDSGSLRGRVDPFAINDTETFDGIRYRERIHGLNLDLVGLVPLNAGFSLLGRVGVLAARFDRDFSALGVSTVAPGSPFPIGFEAFQIPDHANELEYGLGLQYALDRNWAFRGEWQRVQLGSSGIGDLDVFTGGAIYRY